MKKLLITGLIRDEKGLEEFLDKVSSYLIQYKVEVVISTWKGELERSTHLEQLINKFQIKLILQDQPNLLVGDHIVHQILTLDAALLALNDEDYVYKTRSDHLFIDKFILFCESEPEKSLLPNLNQYKFVILEAFLSQPFYINDMTFSGVVSDLKGLTKLNILAPINFANLSAEQFIWGAKIADAFKIIQYFFRLNLGMPFSDKLLSSNVQDFLINNETFINALSIYIWCLANNFKFHDGGDERQPIKDLSSFRLEELLFSNINVQGLRFHEATSMNLLCSNTVLNLIYKGSYKPSLFGERVRDNIKALTSHNRIDVGLLTSNISFLAESFEFKSCQIRNNLPPIKGFQITNKMIEGPSVSTEWKILSGNEEIITHLEAKILELRRALERATS